jgi:monofunctional glycosyltransferase
MTKEKSSPTLLKKLWRIAWKSVMWFFIVTISWVILYRWINPPTTFLQISERCGCPEKSVFHKASWVDADELSPNMKLAVVASEDNNFMKHRGVDWEAVEKAQKYNETTGKRTGKKRGASTITMQVAKNVFLWPGRNFIRKGLEFYFTFLIETFWSKERILEVYLNVIEMGPCKFGVGAAAEDYFKTPAGKLSREQAALIAACLPNPKKMNPGNPGGYMKKRQGQIVRVMRSIGDDYFDTYKEDVAEDKRIEKEKEKEARIKEISPEELPVQVEEDSGEGESEKETQQETQIDEQEPGADSEPAKNDTISE